MSKQTCSAAMGPLQVFLMCLGLMPLVAQADRQFVVSLPWGDAEIESAASDLPPPPTNANCYDPANVGQIGQWAGCSGLLIVENGTGAYGIHTAVNTGITVEGTTYGATGIFTGQVTNFFQLFAYNGSFNEPIGYWDTSSAVTMNWMFRHAYAFNQDLSGWCVSNITSEPTYFNEWGALTSETKPQWGSCP